MENEDKLRYFLKRVSAELDEAHGRLRDAELRETEPIAIVGAGCRLPGADSPEQLWDLVASGVDAVSEFPADRDWDMATLYHPEVTNPGTSHAKEGGFVAGFADFDPGFFGISPREALGMDPQQRLLLEISWEAIERAGIDPVTLRETRTGVFIGTSGQDYSTVMSVAADDAGQHALTGNAAAVVSGRIAYSLGFQGPAVTVDTACSSSLVAMHLACQALRENECSLAVAGGVTLMSTPNIFVVSSGSGGMSPDGRSRAFSADASGTGFAEGAGVVLLERLSHAERNGHRILALISGSALNQDGASSGLSAPNGPAQQRVIRAALLNARLAPAQVDVVEAHGTGTELGDPIEAEALLAAYGQDRDRPLWLGSVKSNIGHTQAAAGVAGVIKMVMALRAGVLPRTLHADEPTPHVDWSSGAVSVLSEARPWPETGGPRRAAVSSFGISGTNAHTILEQYCPAEPAEPAEPVAPAAGPVPWTVSGRGADALREQARRLRRHVTDHPGLTDADIGFSLATTRSRHEHRATLLAGDRDGFLRGLDALAGDRPHAGLVRGVAKEIDEVVFVFPGHGQQWAGMAAELLDSSPVFRARAGECADALAPHLGWPVLDVLRGDPGQPSLDRIDVAQAALFAMMVSLAELWGSYGVRPAAVLGHSQGEIAAACVAGAISLDDAARVVALRGKALRTLDGSGAMASILLPVDEVTARLEQWPGRLALAAVNGPRSASVTGDGEAVAELVAQLTAEGARVRRIPGATAGGHSWHVDRLRDELLRGFGEITPRATEVRMFSAVTGARVDPLTLGTGYWYRNVREPVRFDQATRAALKHGHHAFLEMSAHPMLVTPLQATAEEQGREILAVGSLRRGEGGLERFSTSLAEAEVRGVGVRWEPAFAGAKVVDLPTYAFQRQRYWPRIEAREEEVTASGAEDTAFWQAVDNQDLTELTTALDVRGEDPLSTVLPALSAWRRRRRDESTVDSWRYRLTWRPVPKTAAERGSGTWLLVVPDGVAEDVAAACERALGPADVVRVVGAGSFAEGIAGCEGPVAGVLSLLALNERALPDLPGVSAGLAGNLALLRAADGLRGRLWCATRGAVSIGRSDRLRSLVQAQTWGLGRVAALENPQSWGGLIDLPAVLDDRALARLGEVLTGAEDQVAVRGSGVYGCRLVRAAADTPVEPWRPRGSVLITGGTGAVGAGVARWLAQRGAEHLVLVSRRGEDGPQAAELREELRALGAEVTIAACDAADRDALAAVLAGLPERHPLTAVVHSAAVLDDGVLDSLSPERFAGVLRSKVDAAVHLHELTAGLDLDAFLLFSSMAGITGNAGQGNYAAANAFLDALARQRHADGLPATSIAWGAWGEKGIIAENEAVRTRLRRGGTPGMATDLALSALDGAIAGDDPVLVVADLDWDLFAPGYAGTRPSPLIGDLPEARRALEAGAGPADPAPGRGSSAVRDLAGRLPGEQVRALLDLVRAQVAVVLGHASPDAIGNDRPFKDLGFDSLTAVELRNVLAAALGISLPTTLIFDIPTPIALAEHLRAELFGAEPAVVTTTVAPAAAVDDEPIAIVGMSCRFAGGVRSPEDLWRLVENGVDAIGEFPADRGWPLELIYDEDPDKPGTSYAREGGFVHDAPDFDPGLFGISPREALGMDPQQRMLLEVSWEALERAGIDPFSLRGSQTGVFIGTNYQDYVSLAVAADGIEGNLMTGNASSVISGRLSYTFGLEGPAISVDTACSASLVSLHLAVQALRRGECDLAITGGVTIMATPNVFIGFSRQRGLAPNGRCKPFAAAADGTGWGEGAGVVLVERLSDARRNGHQVLGVVRGSAVNQDGASNGLTAPNGPSQQRVIRRALANARLAGSGVDVVEAHGTGTRLGDPIEAQALLATYGQDRERPLWLGSVKSNIGHTQAAAGVAGVIKMVEAIRHGVLPRTLHVDAPTPEVDWSAGAVSLLTESVPWPETGEPRRAGISSFGVSGTNAHVIIEQAPAEPAAAPPAEAPVRGPAPLVLSGRGDAALRAQARRLLDHVTTHPGQRLADVARSLATTRASLDHRAVLLADTGDDAVRGLTALADGRTAPGLHQGVSHSGGVLAFLFSGQGAQRAGMGRELYAAFPVFADAFDAVCAQLDPELDRPLREVVFGADDELLSRTGYTQAGLFALETALFRLVASWGVHPDYLIGHSVGEIAAAHVAGVLTLEDACTMVAARGRLMQALPQTGAMAAVEASEAEVCASLAGHGDRVELAAVNGPRSTVVSGDEDVVLAVVAHWTALGRKAKRLTVSHAFHSSRMDPMLAEFRRVVAGLTYSPARIAIVSNLTGELAAADELRAPDYWVQHVRYTVRFEDGVRRLRQAGVTRFLELGPDGVLAAMTLDCAAGDDVVAIPVLRRDRPEEKAAFAALAELHVRGVRVAWDDVLAGQDARIVALPTYAFQRERFWPEFTIPSGFGRGTPGSGTGETGTDAEFWAAVEGEDFAALATSLDVDGDASFRSVLPALSSWRRRQRDDAAVESWRYRIGWRPLTGLPAQSPPGNWLALVPAGHEGTETVTTALRSLTDRGTRVTSVVLDPAAAGAERLTAILGERLPAGAGVLSFLALDEDPHPEHPALSRGVAGTLELLRALAGGTIETRLWCLTRGAVAVHPADGAVRPVQAQVWGMGRVAALEHPGFWAGLVDLPEVVDGGLDTVLAGAEDQVALRRSGTYGRRLNRAPLPADVVRDTWRPGGTVLVTGGTGGLGAEVARWLAGNGAEHLVLVSRRGPAATGAAELEAELARLGAKVSIVRCDVSRREEVADVLANLRTAGTPVRAVVHAAGDGRSAPIRESTASEFAEVLAAKVGGARHLDELLADEPLDAFVLFSSIAGVWGSATQAAYAAGNAFLDALAERRRALGRTATSVAWGPWDADSGMATEDAAEQLRKRGLPMMAARLAITSLQHALDAADPALVVADVGWDRFLPMFTFSRPSPLLGDLPEAARLLAADTAAPDGGAEPELRGRLAGLPARDVEQAVADAVAGYVATVLGHDSANRVEATRGFLELGFDSLTALELRNLVTKATGLSVPSTLVFDYPTPAALTGYLIGLLAPGAGGANDPEEDRIRRLLAEIPVSKLRDAGLLDPLLRMSDPGGEPVADDGIETMDAADLVRMALGESGS
ncbi:type I polyketide synthase [Amycolatopsis sp. lyj-346]|uniref:type I polyketide synthase n=1 Tax=Amycolatopsis sp. lyj-346 TaxID=2789289 RepID=UPI00397B6E67